MSRPSSLVEVDRLINTNSSVDSLLFHLRFFINKLAERGYDKTISRQVVRDALYRASLRISQPRIKQQIRKHYVRVVYSSSSNAFAIRRSIWKYKTHIQHLGHVGVSHSVQRSLFRRLYATNWPKRWSWESWWVGRDSPLFLVSLLINLAAITLIKSSDATRR